MTQAVDVKRRYLVGPTGEGVNVVRMQDVDQGIFPDASRVVVPPVRSTPRALLITEAVLPTSILNEFVPRSWLLVLWVLNKRTFVTVLAVPMSMTKYAVPTLSADSQ